MTLRGLNNKLSREINEDGVLVDICTADFHLCTFDQSPTALKMYGAAMHAPLGVFGNLLGSHSHHLRERPNVIVVTWCIFT